MSPKTAARPTNKQHKDPRPEIVRRLKETAGQYQDYQGRIGPLLQTCWRLTWEYVDVTIVLETAKNTTKSNAIARLSRLLKRTAGSTQAWYFHGRFAAEYGIQKADQRAVDLFYSKHRALSKSEVLRCVDACKKLKGDEAVARVKVICGKSSGAAVAAGESRANRLMNKKDQWTEKRMKMDLMAEKTVLTRFYGQEVLIFVVTQDDQTPLLEV